MRKFGIPTKHKGRQFRSRLEARWGAFFDRLGWPYEYEPFDLNGWIPDFLILGATPVLVEVKPVYVFPRFVADEIKVSGIPDDHEALILGCTIPVKSYGNSEYVNPSSFGWLFECEYGWADAVFGRWEACNGRIGFCHSAGQFVDRISGEYDGGSYGGLLLSDHETLQLWADAGNKTQWMAPR